MTRGAEAAGAAGEHQQVVLTTVGTADSGKPTARVAAVKIALDHLFDDRAEEAILSLEAALILAQEAVKVME